MEPTLSDGSGTDDEHNDIVLASPRVDTYVRELENASGLHLLHPERIKSALRLRGPMGRFALFLPQIAI